MATVDKKLADASVSDVREAAAAIFEAKLGHHLTNILKQLTRAADALEKIEKKMK